MSEEIIMSIALIIAGIVGFVTYKKKIGGKTKKQKFIEKAARAGHFTTGHYESSKVILGAEGSSNVKYREDKLKVKYKYEINGIAYYKSMIFQSTGRVGTNFPSEVKVYYDPSNPKNAVCPEEATKAKQVRSGCFVTIGVTILTLAVSFYILRFLLGGGSC